MLRWKIAQWFELRWWLNYLHGKDKATYLSWKKNYWLSVLSKIADKTKPAQTVVDLGCGPAGIFIALPENEITAVDPLLREYAMRTAFFKESDYPNVNFVCSKIEDFNANGKTYDAVYCMNAINHVLDIGKGFSRLKELCAAAGCIVVSVDAHNFSLFKYLFRLIPGDILHPHQYDLNEYKAFLNSEGWQLAEPVLIKHEFFFDHYVLVARKAK